MAIDFSQLRWDDIVNQARQDWLRQTGTDTGNGGVDQYNGATTNIGGTQAQIMLNGMPYAGNFLGTQGWGAEGRPDYAVQNAEGLYEVPLNSDYAWNNAIFNMPNPGYVAPDGTTDWNFTLGRGEDGGVTATPYKRTNGVPAGMLAVLAAPLMAAYGPGLFGAEAGAGAAGTSAGGLAAEGSLGSGLSLSSGGITGITGATGAGGLTAGAGTGLGLTTAGTSAGALGSLAPGFFTGETLAGLGAGGLAGGALAAGAGGSTLSNLGSAASTAGRLLNSPLGAAALGALAGGASGGASSAGNQTITTQQQIDPRMAQILYGSNGDNGFLSQILGQANRPQSTGMATLGSGVDAWLGSNGASQMRDTVAAANSLRDSSLSSPQMQAAIMQAPPEMRAALMQAAQVNAPSQNNTDLSNAYQNMIYGDPAQNPYLTGAIQKGINQSRNAFNDLQLDATRNLTENVLPSLGRSAQLNGQYGGSRQGIAEGLALRGFGDSMGRAAERFGQNATDAAVSAQAGQFDAGQNRALSAMSGLGAQQYGVAGQNASFQQQGNLANQSSLNDAARTNYAGQLQTNQANAAMQQAANQANLQSQLSTNQLNSANQVAGIGANSSLLNQAYNMGTNNDAYSLNRLNNVSGTLAPYTGLGASSTQTSPLYQNTTGNILGGATAGLGLWNAVNQSGMLGGGGLNNWLGNNAGVAGSTGLGWSDLASAF